MIEHHRRNLLGLDWVLWMVILRFEYIDLMGRAGNLLVQALTSRGSRENKSVKLQLVQAHRFPTINNRN